MLSVALDIIMTKRLLYSEICLNQISLGLTFVFRIDKCSVYMSYK
jgi:hypothetical protein